jgi:hypothetical protein
LKNKNNRDIIRKCVDYTLIFSENSGEYVFVGENREPGGG